MRRSLIAILIVPFVLFLSACGDDDDDVDAGTTTEAVAPGDGTTTEPEAPDATTDPGATDPEAAVEGFMDARVSGAGAEAFLTELATDVYPAEIPLYDVTGYEIEAVEEADANSFEVLVQVTTDDGSTRTETMFVGPGESADGTSLPFAIRGAVEG